MSIFDNLKNVFNKTKETVEEHPMFKDKNYFENIAKEIIPEDSIPKFHKEYDGDEQIYQHLIEYKYKGDFDYTSPDFFLKYNSDKEFREDIQKSLFVINTGEYIGVSTRIIIPRDKANEYPNCKKFTLFTLVSNNINAAQDKVLAPYAQYDITKDLLDDNGQQTILGSALENF